MSRLREALDTVEAVERELDDIVIVQLSFTGRMEPGDGRRIAMLEDIQDRVSRLAGELAVVSRTVKLELAEQRANA